MMNDRSEKIKQIIFDAFCFTYLACLLLLAVLQPNEEQMLNLSYNASLALLVFVVGLASTFLLSKSAVKTLGRIIFQPAYKRLEYTANAWYKSFWSWQLIITFSVTLLVALRVTNFSIAELTDEDGFAGAIRLFQGLLNPNFNLLPQAILAIFETIYIAFLATVIAIPIAFALCFVAAKNIMGQTKVGYFIYMSLRTLMNISRSIEPLIWAIIFSVWVGIGPFAGMLALMIHSIASLTKQYSEQVEVVDDGPIEGVASTGANALQVVWFAIVPQVVLPFISFTIYRWDINVRMATIIGLVGGGGIGNLLIQYQGQAMWAEVGCIILVIAVVVWLMDAASAILREAIK